jgi:hypothetical protein
MASGVATGTRLPVPIRAHREGAATRTRLRAASARHGGFEKRWARCRLVARVDTEGLTEDARDKSTTPTEQALEAKADSLLQTPASAAFTAEAVQAGSTAEVFTTPTEQVRDGTRAAYYPQRAVDNPSPER